MKKRKNVLWVLEIIIIIVAILHLLRAVFNLPLIVGTTQIPMWLSYVAFLILGFLSYKLWGELK